MKKFSLLELLIVIAIIGILLSILLPSLQKARFMAKTAVCLSNTKQINIAISSYMVKNDGLYPYGAFFSGSKNISWDDLLIGYDGRSKLSNIDDWWVSNNEEGASLYLCPLGKYTDNPWVKMRSYSINGGFNGPRQGVADYSYSVYSSQVVDPGNTILIAERDQSLNYLGGQQCAITWYSIDYDSHSTINQNIHGYGSMSAQERRAINFCDGSSKVLSKLSTISDKNLWTLNEQD